ncbi:MAG: hypothetical protein ACLQGU_17750 [bacterium]
MREEIEKAVKGYAEALENLRKVLVEVCLTDEYDKRTLALREESERIFKERSDLAQNFTELKRICEAKAVVLRREGEEALSRGNRAGSQKKEAEAKEAENQIKEATEKIENLDGRNQLIKYQINDIGRKIFLEETFPGLQETLPSLNRRWENFLTEVRHGLENYVDHTKLGNTGQQVYYDGLIRRNHWEAMGL